MNKIKFVMLLGCAFIGVVAFAGDFSISNEDTNLTLGVGPALTCAEATHQDVLNQCKRCSSENCLKSCVEVSNGHYFASCSLGICGRFSSETGFLNCLSIIKDHEFLAEDILICDRNTTESGALSCLKAAVKPHNGPGEKVHLIEARRQVIKTIDDFNNNGANQAISDLRTLLIFLNGKIGDSSDLIRDKANTDPN